MVMTDITATHNSGVTLDYKVPHVICDGVITKSAIYNNHVDAQRYADRMNKSHPGNTYYVREQTL